MSRQVLRTASLGPSRPRADVGCRMLIVAVASCLWGCASSSPSGPAAAPAAQEPRNAAAPKPAVGHQQEQPQKEQTASADELRRLIEQKLEQARKEAATRPAISPTVRTSPTPPREVAPTLGQVTYEATQVTPGQQLSAAKPEPAASQPGTSQPAASQPAKAGCGSQEESVDLTPPPPGQPQPKFVCENETLDIGPVWRGRPAKFVFKIRNEGEGPLNILIKRG